MNCTMKILVKIINNLPWHYELYNEEPDYDNHIRGRTQLPPDLILKQPNKFITNN